MDDNVIQLFKSVPVQAAPQPMGDFIEDYLGDFLFAVQALDQASDVETFRSHKADIERMVREWPRV